VVEAWNEREGPELRSRRGDARDWIARRRLRGLLLRGIGPARPEEVVGHLTAMQAQEHAYARWSVAQRMAGSPSASDADAAFDEGRILRTHVLRPTWHYVAADDLRWLIRLSGPRVDAANARRHRELGLDAKTLIRSNDVIAQAVADGAWTRRELADILERHGISIAGQRIAYMLMHAELTAVICSGGMRGTQHTYAAFDQRVPAGRSFEGDEALAQLAWRYFSTRGPATLGDFSWWSGLRAPEARRGLQMVEARLASHEVDGRTYWSSDQGTHRSTSRIDLVQCYDEVIISYTQSRDVLHTASARFPVPRHLEGFLHVLLLDGRLLGHWRAHAGSDGVRIETRTTGRLDWKDQVALGRAIERYRRFAQPG
jgi:Winged helix DNA-binding domain